MRQLFTLMLLGVVALTFSACHCKTCHVGGPGDCCVPCPEKPKPLKRPRPKARCELPKWPERPVKCVTTQVCRKCCHCENHTTAEGYKYQIEVCEITYKSLYTDGSTKIWTEVSRNPVTKSASPKKSGRTWRSRQPLRHSIVGDRCDDDGSSLSSKIQHMDKHIGQSVGQIGSKVKSDLSKVQ